MSFLNMFLRKETQTASPGYFPSENHLANHLFSQFSHDTNQGMTLEEYIDIVKEQGFEIVFEEEFFRPKEHSWRFVREKLIVLANKSNGFLLVIDSKRRIVRQARLYFNLLVVDSSQFPYLPFRGGMRRIVEGEVLAGSLDVVKGCKYWLNILNSIGKPITPWVFDPKLCIMHYMDTEPHESTMRLRSLPSEVQKMIRASLKNAR